MIDGRKENMIVGIIMASAASPETKTELIDYIRGLSAEKQAVFRLGQMDMRESMAACLLDESKVCGGEVQATLIAAADYIKSMEVI